MKTLGFLLFVALSVVWGFIPSGRAAVGDDGPARPATPAATYPSAPAHPTLRFAAIHVYVDSGDKPLAAYQFELTATTGDVRLSGLEGGEHAAFNSAPYYDPRALLNSRLVVAAFSMAADLPRGRTRVATLHVMVAGAAEPAYSVKLQAAATVDGSPVDAKVTLVPASDAHLTTVSPDTGTAPASQGALP